MQAPLSFLGPSLHPAALHRLRMLVASERTKVDSPQLTLHAALALAPRRARMPPGSRAATARPADVSGPPDLRYRSCNLGTRAAQNTSRSHSRSDVSRVSRRARLRSQGPSASRPPGNPRPPPRAPLTAAVEEGDRPLRKRALSMVCGHGRHCWA